MGRPDAIVTQSVEHTYRNWLFRFHGHFNEVWRSVTWRAVTPKEKEEVLLKLTNRVQTKWAPLLTLCNGLATTLLERYQGFPSFSAFDTRKPGYRCQKLLFLFLLLGSGSDAEPVVPSCSCACKERTCSLLSRDTFVLTARQLPVARLSHVLATTALDAGS